MASVSFHHGTRVDGDTTADTYANLVGDQTSYTGVHAFKRAVSDGLYKPKLLIAPGFTQSTPADGIASITVTTGGTGYAADTTEVEISGTGGSGAEAIVEEGVITGITVTKPGYGYSGTITVTITGDGENAAATAIKGSVINPIVAELMGVAEKLRAIAYVDGPDTTDQVAVTYRGLINSGRVFVCDPKVLKFDTESAANVAKPSSPIWAARQAKMDLEQGFWWAGSSVEIAGIVGVNRPVVYGTQSDYLNENRVNTIVNIDNTGFRLWGVWTCDSDTLWQFVSVTGALAHEDGTINATAYIRGRLIKNDHGTWTPGEAGENDFSISLRYYRLEVDGTTLIEATPFDVSIGGVSQTNSIRSALLA